ncbi:hypothetical protein [Providencia rettgeri]|uniref:hypothetical protein n=1 Tax=Providencia rettgeri TaxID=587 RepID=UPI000D851B5D|nr:hypothetical protein [Providencia rettgeri]PYZ58648.1 hypothetical protein DNK63_05740 [Providencia rettgeri]
MLPLAIADTLLLKLNPALRNPRYYQTYQAGREQCLARGLAGDDITAVPLYSHNQTYQSFFRQGWLSVTAQDIRLAKVEVTHVRFT